MRHSFRIPQRCTDLSPGNQVDHTVLIDYLQETRTEFLLGAPEPMRSMLGGGVFVTGHQVAYLAPIGYSEDGVTAEVWVDQVGGARFSLSYRLSDRSGAVAEARTFLAPFDLTAGALRRLTAEEREQLSATLADPVPIEPLGRVRAEDLAAAVETPCRVRWADLDSYRHVNNVRYFDYLSQARLQLLGALGGIGDTAGAPATEPWTVVRQDIDYRIPLDFRLQPYRVRTAVAGIGDASVDFVADIVDPLEEAPRSFATARTVLLHAGVDGEPEPIPDATRARLEAAI